MLQVTLNISGVNYDTNGTSSIHYVISMCIAELTLYSPLATFNILSCITPDNFTHQCGTSGQKEVKVICSPDENLHTRVNLNVFNFYTQVT